MAEPRNLKISVENFGPIREGSFELKPLTIFIGPNNTGKSYMALLVHALVKAFHRKVPQGYLGLNKEESEKFIVAQRSNGLRDEILSRLSPDRPINFGDLSDSTRYAFLEVFNKVISGLESDFENVLGDYFANKHVKELAYLGGRRNALTIALHAAPEISPLFSFQWRSNQNISDVNLSLLRLDGFPLGGHINSPIVFDLTTIVQQYPDFLPLVIMAALWLELLISYGFPWGEVRYLPTGRAGLSQGWPVFAAMAVQQLRKGFGRERIEIPPMPGIVWEYFQTFFEQVASEQRRPIDAKLLPALGILEQEIIGGEIVIQTEKSQPPGIVYRSGKLFLPLQRASSAIAELATLDLWIKHVLVPGDLLIIDEPEAHLHPENQRLIARVLVRLVRSGVKVLCTTHSSLILHQVSNMLLASQASPEAREQLGFTEHDLINADEVGVYLFRPQRGGVRIKPVEIEPGVGISEEEFVRVSEAIGDETYRLSLSALRDE